MLNMVAIMGRLVADPELRTTPAGVSVCTFRIACDQNFVRPGEQRQADFIDIVAWRSKAEFVCRYFKKGSLIAIDGSIQTRTYQDKQGNNRSSFAIAANNINFAGSKVSNAQPVDDGGEAPPAGYRANEPAPEYAGGDDFAVIDDTDDLPF